MNILGILELFYLSGVSMDMAVFIVDASVQNLYLHSPQSGRLFPHFECLCIPVAIEVTGHIFLLTIDYCNEAKKSPSASSLYNAERRRVLSTLLQQQLREKIGNCCNLQYIPLSVKCAAI